MIVGLDTSEKNTRSTRPASGSMEIASPLDFDTPLRGYSISVARNDMKGKIDSHLKVTVYFLLLSTN